MTLPNWSPGILAGASSSNCIITLTLPVCASPRVTDAPAGRFGIPGLIRLIRLAASSWLSMWSSIALRALIDAHHGREQGGLNGIRGIKDDDAK